MLRVGVDATAVSAAGKGHARSQRKLVEALAALGRYEVVAYVRTHGRRPRSCPGSRLS